MRAVALIFLLLSFAKAESPTPLQISWQMDLPVFFGSVALQVSGQKSVENMEAFDPSSEKAHYLPWDRPLRGIWSAKANLGSDILLGAIAVPFTVEIVDWKNGLMTGKQVFSDMVVLSEILLLNSGLNLWTRGLRVWPRPLVFSSAPAGEKSSAQAAGSFYSGHASASFAVAIWAGSVTESRHPNTDLARWTWIGSLAAAGSIAGLRVAAGKHTFTDVGVGALIGSGLSWVMLRLHRSKSLSVTTLPQGAVLSYRF